jgi:hypothetical protein
MTNDHGDFIKERDRLRQALLEARRRIEALLTQAADSGQPLSMLEKGRIDEQIAAIKQLAARYQSLPPE